MSHTRDSLTAKLERYQKKLLQLQKSNRCICLGKIYKKHAFDISKIPHTHYKRIDDMTKMSFRRQGTVCILPDSDSSEEATSIRQHLKTLARNIQQLEDETGSQYCFLGFPFLEGHITPEHYVRGPLVLFYVSIQHTRGPKTTGWHITFADSMPILNHTLFAALEEIGGYHMPDTHETDFEEGVRGITGKSVQSMEEQLHHILESVLSGAGLELSTPDHTDTHRTTPLANLTRNEIMSLERQPLRIIPYKILGSFPQGESAIYQDYESLMELARQGDTSKFISDILEAADSAEEPPEYDVDEDNTDQANGMDHVRDRDLNLVVPSDSSQDMVVLDSQRRDITLVRGPPGTGKSQMIVNVISNAISKGQTVLAVCQKRAALEVIHQRLDSAGLAEYAVLLNKEKEDRANMYHQIHMMLEYPDPSRNGGRRTAAISRDIDKIITEHAKMARALDQEMFGVRVGSLYAKSTANDTRKLDLSDVAVQLTQDSLEELLEVLPDMEEDYKKFDSTTHPWSERRDFSKLGISDRDRIRDILDTILSANGKYTIILQSRPPQSEIAKLAKECAELASDSRDDIDAHGRAVKDMLETHHTPESVSDPREAARRAEAGVLLWSKMGSRDSIMQALHNHIAEPNIKSQSELLDILSQPPKKASFLDKIRNRPNAKMEKIRNNFCRRPQNQGKSIDELVRMVRNGLALWEIVSDAVPRRYIFENPIILGSEDDQRALHSRLVSWSDAEDRFRDRQDRLREASLTLNTMLEQNQMSRVGADGMSQLAMNLGNGVKVLECIGALAQYLDEEVVNTLSLTTFRPDILMPHIQSMDSSLEDFDDMVAHDSRKQDLSQEHRTILERCAATLNAGESWADAIRNKTYLRWIDIIEREHPVLKSGSFDDYSRRRQRLEELLRDRLAATSQDIREYIESRIDFRPGSGNKRTARQTKYHKLNQELSKRRRVKPVRKILEQYGDILFGIAPCWLASPEMVSNIFPLKKDIFDIIIVDEASQLAAERALPFLYRGKRIIIAGDEKQLKPHDLFQIKEEDDDEDEIANIESLLVLAKRRHPTSMLRWHYRSQWQELIDFSNHAFYNGRLQVAPNARRSPPSPPIRWVECSGGIWENRANMVEAGVVVDVLKGILERDEKNPPTIGIITFNDQQRNVILDEIDVRCAKDPYFEELYSSVESPASGKKDDEIFVRNIENVQGDERDIIIFSVGYAPDHSGTIRMRFGTLNQDGGENRLNVAVTRASKEMVVVCSIDPRDLRVEGTKNDGPKRLRDFLEYAKAISQGDGADHILERLGSAMNRRGRRHKVLDSIFEEKVHDRLAGMGYVVDTQVGQSGYRIDLAVVHPDDPDRYILGIECDGATFHSAKSVRERDVARQSFLERMGWNMDRIWSRKWWKNSDVELDRIRRRIDDLVQKDRTVAPPSDTHTEDSGRPGREETPSDDMAQTTLD